MNRKTKNYLRDYMKISGEVKHITNSLMRLQLLFSLYESDKTMKEISKATGLSYSAISTNIRLLEVENYIVKDGNYYVLSNIMRLYLKNLSEFDKTIGILKEFFNLFENHKVRNIPIDAVSDLYLLEDSSLVESCGTDIYKINEVIIETLKKSNEMKAILPVSFKELTGAINRFIKKGKRTELKIASNIFEDITKNMDLKPKNLHVKEFTADFNFLLIILKDTMILGLYKKDGTFDQNRILMSNSEESLKWANKLFNSI